MRLRTLGLIPLLLACASTGDVSSDATRLTQTVEREIDVRPGGKLDVKNVNGRIDVTTWEQRTVKVVAVKKAKGRRGADAKSILKETEIKIDRTENTITVRAERPEKRWNFGNGRGPNVNYTVTVPRRFDVKAKSVNGKVGVDGVSGHVSAETVNGRVDLSRISGSFQAKSVNGKVGVELVESSGTEPLQAKTVNGSIDVVLPPDIGAQIKAKTTNGKIYTEFGIKVKGTIGKSLNGEINGGGKKINLSTVNGGIKIREWQEEDVVSRRK